MSKIREFILIISIFLIFLVLIYGIVFFKNQITGKVSLELDTSYQEGESLDGILKVALKEGELIPASSKIIFENAGELYEYKLSEIVSENPIEGDFYVEGFDISGNGQGFGIEGIKAESEVIHFKLNVYSKTYSGGSGGGQENQGSSSEEAVSPGNLDNLPELPEQSPVEDKLPEQVPEESESPELPEQSPVEDKLPEQAANKEKNKDKENKITGKVSLEISDEISGDVSIDNEFVYDLPPGKSVEIVEGSVRTSSGEILPNNAINLNTRGNKVTVTTDYSEEGFGEEYVGENTKILEIDLSKLNFIPKEGDLSISLVYEDKNILSLITPLTQGRINIKNETQSIEADEFTSFYSINLTEEDRKILSENLGDYTLEITKAERNSENIIVRFEVKDYWVEHYYNSNLLEDDLSSKVEEDKINFIHIV